MFILNAMELLRKAIFIFIVAVFLLRIPLIFVRYFDQDEFEHVHATRSLCHETIPYRDYFQHHTPFLYFLLAPAYIFSGDRIETLFILRGIMLIFAFGILYLTYVLARILYGADVALYAAFFLSYMTVFISKTLEIRPDVPAVFFELLTIIFFIKGAREKKNIRAQQLLFFVAGITLGIAILFTQKMLFFAAGIFLSLLWIAYDKRVLGRMGPFLWVGLGISVFPLITCLYFLFNNALGDFIHRTFIMVLFWKDKMLPFELTALILKKNTFFCIAGLAGLIIAAAQLKDKRAAKRADFVPFLLLCVFVLGLFVVPIPYLQYYLFFIPLVSIYCGLSFEKIIDRLILFRTTKRVYRWNNWTAYFILIGVVVLFLQSRVPELFRLRPRIAIHSNASQLAGIQFILYNSDAQDSVLDGWSGLGVFRDHACYYYFLHSEIRHIFSPEYLSEDILAALRKNEPKFVIFDSNIKDISERLTNYVKEYYAPVGIGDIYIRISS